MRLKKLSIPTIMNDDVLEDESGTAVLLVRDGASRKWGPRWLGQSGLRTTAITDFSSALETVIAAAPDVVVIEAALPGRSGSPIYKELQEAAEFDAPVIVLCSNSNEIDASLSAGVVDVACKPFEWQAIGNRARIAWRLDRHERLLAARRSSLKEAIELADGARKELRSQQVVEPVTGLPNRSKFVDMLARGMRSVDREKNALAVFVIGFTRFHLIVEAMGQEQADSILTEIGQNLVGCLQEYGTAGSANHGLRTAAVASLDQARFGLMLTYSGEDDELAIFRHQVSETLSQPLHISGQIVQLSACLGVTLYPQDADDVDSLLQRADNAMRDAQSRGGGYRFYSSETDAAAARKLKLEHMLHEALDRGELSLAYQPILDVKTGETVAAEALLRWRQRDGSYISPDEFVAVAEESGLIIRIGEFALDEACRQISDWRASGLILPLMCVNVAKAQLMSSTFAQSVKRILDKHDVEPLYVELEISERGVMSGEFDVIEQLQALKNLGINISIDDFGTGDSAIAYLKDLPVDTLKIDQSYTAGMTNNSKDAAIASAMVALGQRLDLFVIAEGVETVEQLEAFRELGCDAYQGFLESEAIPASGFAKRLKK